ncbi:MATE family efflux transporter [Vibrio comitans]|uniref:Multidrug resistance protein NorM n=1 Tax=Vibrio comitans NBRC 102076 TaxID=1219078 RepID=A0A4Y3ISR9_9VIBR|nr:MATE family efflux transporter [Vibrio comitans]GEA62277.1 MATE efflux family protein [Vibrio comitans NBRC 102076]
MTSQSLSKQILTIAIPVSLKLFLDMAMILIDLFMIGQLGSAELTAVGMGLVLLAGSIGVLDNLFATGGGILVARLTGAKREQCAANVLGGMFLIALPLYLIGTLAIPFVADLYLLFHTTAEVAVLGDLYFGTLVAGSIFIYLDVLLFTYFVSTGNSKLPMKIKIASLGLNVVFNYLFIFGNAGAPAMGIKGAALGTIVATSFNVALYLIVIKQSFTHVIQLRHSLTHLKDILKLGVPSVVENFTFQISWLFIISLINSYAASAAAGFQIGYRVESIAFLPGLGTAAAAATLVSRFVGANRSRDIDSVTSVTATLTCLFMGGVGGLMAIIPESFASLFTNELSVINDAATYIRIIGLAQIPLGLQFVYTASLRGLGDVSKTAIIKVVLLWLNIVIPSSVIAHLGLDVIWLFTVIALANVIDAAVFITRFKRLRAQSKMATMYSAVG